MPKARITSGASGDKRFWDLPFTATLDTSWGLPSINLARRYGVSPLGLASWFLREFHCPGCNGQRAYRFRYRGLAEQVFLTLIMLKPVRCERCYHRSYILRTVPAQEPGRRSGALAHQADDSSAGRRVA
jgi:hypothetical protein